jgi:hypothetical protein
MQAGRPGDTYALMEDGLSFAQGRHWVRIQGREIPDALLKRIAVSVSNRIGASRENPPSLISHLPEMGYDAGSLRYFPSLSSFKYFAGEAAVKSLNLVSDVEIAQAQYAIDNNSGSLLLLSFPTSQVADDYFATAAIGNIALENHTLYAKKVGLLVAVLSGPISPASADGFLRSIRYSYSIRWIFEKKNQTKIVWGVPVRILGTIVRSLFFIAILGVVSILAGAVFAISRFFIRNRFSKNETNGSNEADIIKLRLR